MMHVLKDEKLGIDREYVAVDRKAEVGEKIYTLVGGGNFYVESEYGVVHSLDGNCVQAKFESNYLNTYWLINNDNYHVLEPTDIVHIDGERYRLEDRKAEVGEKIIITNSVDFPIGFVDSVSDFDDFHDDGSCTLVNGFDGDDYFDGLSEHYNVLTPVQDAAEAQESDVITVLANLGAEVAELKRKNEHFEKALGWNEMGPGYIPELRNGLSELKSVVAEYESEIGRMQAEINALHEDKVRLGEQLAKLAAGGDPKALSFTTAELAELFVALKKAGL